LQVISNCSNFVVSLCIAQVFHSTANAHAFHALSIEYTTTDAPTYVWSILENLLIYSHSHFQPSVEVMYTCRQTVSQTSAYASKYTWTVPWKAAITRCSTERQFTDDELNQPCHHVAVCGRTDRRGVWSHRQARAKLTNGSGRHWPLTDVIVTLCKEASAAAQMLLSNDIRTGFFFYSRRRKVPFFG
jgi:hypothetical protein